MTTLLLLQARYALLLLLTFFQACSSASPPTSPWASLNDHLNHAGPDGELSSLKEFNDACETHRTFHPNAPPSRSLFPSAGSYHVSMYVHIISSCLGPASGNYALQEISKSTNYPLFSITDETTMDELLGAFVTFKVVEDVESINSLTEFAVSKLSLSLPPQLPARIREGTSL